MKDKQFMTFQDLKVTWILFIQHWKHVQQKINQHHLLHNVFLSNVLKTKHLKMCDNKNISQHS